ncbi:MarR family transcriptional regulator [Aureimonas sp. SA4125]|uniref:MarR family winged helix-turn-helix transcriptional regulator n=1 Tax=Aureimonas sp. SA4125 TaxID=2826993 RepID=UPI001CC59FD3|nr:MarR family transcriptional regulator [Aureimonas sp. SA4125]BDA86383.1 MarR family transcriptional regulator [Aureimonas sp. SA4125]
MPNEEINYPAGFMLADVARLMRVELDRSVAETGLDLSAGDIRALMNIARYFDGVRQCDIAKGMNVEPMTISAYLDRLESSHLVRRQADPRDRRARVVHVTDAAGLVLQQVQPMLAMVYENAMRGVATEARLCTEASLETARANLSRQRSLGNDVTRSSSL